MITVLVKSAPQEIAPARVAAFFDLDGTLLAEPSLEKRLFHALRRAGEIPLANYFRWLSEAVRLFPRGIATIKHGNKRYLAGLSHDLVFRHVDEIPFFHEAVSRLVWHAHQRHELVLVSGTLEPLAHLAATALECELESRGIEARIHVCATAMEERHGIWTGRVLRDAMYGGAKRHAVLQHARRHSIDLRDSHAYGNDVLDGHMLSVVGHPHAVNPNKPLAALANLYDWPVWHWHHEKMTRASGLTRLETKISQPESRV